MKQDFMKKIRGLNRNWKIAIAVVIAILIIWIIWPSTKDKNIDKATTQLLDLASEIRMEYNKKPDYWGLNTEKVISSESAPEGMIRNNVIKNALGSIILVGRGATGEMLMPGDRTFDIIYTDIDYKQCTKLAAYGFSENESLGIISLTIINEGEENIFEWRANNGKTIEIGDALQICKSQNRLIWTFSN